MIRAARPLQSLRSSIRLTRGYAQPAVASAASGSSGLSPLAQAAAEEVSSKWRGTSATGGRTKNYIGGEFVESKADKWLEVRDPVSYRLQEPR
jgi:malonate-semialdehyde dehydrogenase (acetylating)/methylmalonate-semialdehyde dehydrogenase